MKAIVKKNSNGANHLTVVDNNGDSLPKYRLKFINETYTTYSRGKSTCVRCEIECSFNFFSTAWTNSQYFGTCSKFDINSAISKFGGIVAENGTFKVVGHSKCHGEDIFDITNGKHLAQSRAKVKAYRTAGKIMINAANNIEAEFNKIMASAMFYATLFDSENSHINNDLIK